jgi:hypothetical protein
MPGLIPISSVAVPTLHSNSSSSGGGVVHITKKHVPSNPVPAPSPLPPKAAQQQSVGSTTNMMDIGRKLLAQSLALTSKNPGTKLKSSGSSTGPHVPGAVNWLPIGSSRILVSELLKHTVNASNFGSRGNFGLFLPSSVISVNESCAKNEQNRICRSNGFLLLLISSFFSSFL